MALTPGSKEFDDYVHDQIGSLFEAAVPAVRLMLNTGSELDGPDIEVPEAALCEMGFRYGEIEPLTSTGFARFQHKEKVWKLEGQVQAITYDYVGNIYYTFAALQE